MQQDLQLRAAARAIYDTCYPGEDWAPTSFDEAERHRTVHYRQAVDAARHARQTFGTSGKQLALFGALDAPQGFEFRTRDAAPILG